VKIEIELKWALDAAGHARLAGLLAPVHALEQDNRFYDSADRRLQRAGLNVRVRREDGRIVLTCKRRLPPDASGATRHEEHERTLADDRDLPLPPAWRTVLAGAPLVCLGGFANRRLEHQDGPHLLCLDRTDFGARIDHELEIETAEPEAACARWSEKLNGWGIAWTPQPFTKFARFLALSASSS
jgi:uncharacterized protein YjbK